MNTKLPSKSKYWTSILILLLFAFAISSNIAYSSPLHNDELRRAEMIQIAERYASHVWAATQDNILHGERLIGSDWWQD